MSTARHAILLAPAPWPDGTQLASRQLGGSTLRDRALERLRAGGITEIEFSPLADAPVFIVSGDSVWLDGPVSTLGRMTAALTKARDAVILVHRTFQIHAEIGDGDFSVDPWGVPRRRRDREIAPYAYAGIALLRPRLLQNWAGDAPGLQFVLDRAMAAGTLLAVVHDGLWFRLTQAEDFVDAEHALAAQLTGATT